MRVTKHISPNLFVENNSVLFEPNLLGCDPEQIPALGAITLVSRKEAYSQTLQDLAGVCGREAFALVKEILGPSFKAWLFVSDGPWQDGSPYIRHKKLWKNNPELIRSDPHATRSEEIEFSLGDKIRFAGFLEITDGLIDKAIEATRTHSCFAIICTRRQKVNSADEIRQIFENAFPRVKGIPQSNIDWMRLAHYLCPKGDVLFRVSGKFDDIEAAIDLIGDPNVLSIASENQRL